MANTEVVVVDGLIRTIDLAVSIRTDKFNDKFEEVIKRKVSTIILEYFSLDRFDFGKSLSLGDLTRDIFDGVNEVRFATVENLSDDVHVNFNEIIQLNNITVNVVYV